jgi:hypothetical protein
MNVTKASGNREVRTDSTEGLVDSTQGQIKNIK